MPPRSSLARYAVALAIFAALCLYASRAVRIEADFAAFLPPSATPEERLLVAQLREGLVTRLMLVAIHGGDERALAQASRALAERLSRDPTFDYAANGSAGQFAAQGEVLMRNRYALSADVTAERFAVPALRAALEESLAQMASPAGILTRANVARDPTGEFRATLARARPAAAPARRRGVWFSADGDSAFLIAQTRAPGFDSEGQAAAMARVRAALGEAAPQLKVTLSGPGVFAAESRRLIRADALRLGMISTGVILMLLAFVYRSALAVGLVLTPTAFGLLAGVLVVQAVFGSVHAITLGFAATLIGESVDYPSYVMLNAQPGETARGAAHRIRSTLLLAVLTTVASALALTFSSFKGLAQLGVLTMVGVAVAGLTSYALIPWLLGERLLQFPSLRVPGGDAFARAQGLRLAAIAATLIAVGWLAATHPDWWEHDLANVSPIPAAMRAEDASLRRQMGAPEVSVFLASRGSSEAAALEAAEAILPALDRWQAAGLIRSYDSPARYLPSPSTQAARLSALPDNAALEANLRDALRGLPYRAEAFAPFVADVAAARGAAPLTRAAYAGTPLGTKVNAQVIALEGQWLVLTPLGGVADPSAVRAALAKLPNATTRLVDLKEVSTGMLESFRHEATRQALMGVALICVLLAAGLGSIRRAFRVAAPVAAALPITIALLVAAGQRIGVFHVVALLLVLGIGLNYALFFERPAANETQRERARLAIALCSVATLITFGILALSATPVLRAIGATVALGAAVCLVLAALWAAAQPTDRELP
ncbi:MAG: MMPL family transporter [Usitatibacter sp.]